MRDSLASHPEPRRPSETSSPCPSGNLPPAANECIAENERSIELTGGVPGIEERQLSVMMGKGPAVKYYDWDGALGMTGNNVPRRLTNSIIEVAKKHGIPFQREVMTGGGTDAWSAAFAGKSVLAGGISIPQRYMHTPVGTVKLSDLVQTADLLEAFVQEYKL